MSELTDKIVNQLNAATTVEELGDSLWMGSDLIKKARSQHYSSGFDIIDKEEINADEAFRIQAALVEALDRSSDPKFIGAILSALSTSRDANLKSLYVKNLAEHIRKLKANNGVIYSALLGLDALGESVLEGNSQSLIDVDKNVRQAQKYLQSLGIVDPW